MHEIAEILSFTVGIFLVTGHVASYFWSFVGLSLKTGHLLQLHLSLSFLAFSLIPSHAYSLCLFLGNCERQCDNLSGISGKQVPSPQWLMWLNNCSNLANVFLGCRGRWPAAGYQALCMARLPNPAQGTWFPALQGPCRCLCCTLQVFMWCRGKKWWYARYFACPLSSPSAMSWQTCLRVITAPSSVTLTRWLSCIQSEAVVEILLSVSPALSWTQKERKDVSETWYFQFLPRDILVPSVVSELILKFF